MEARAQNTRKTLCSIWHISCSHNLRAIVKLSILRTAVPILTLSGVLLCSLEPSADAGFPNAQQFEPVLAKFNSPDLPTYRAFRKLEAGTPGSGKHGWLEVSTEYQPGAGFAYSVVREGGYAYVRNKVLRGVLKGEAELIANGHPLRAPIVPRNYDIQDGGITESGLTRLLLRPVRKSDGLIRGSAFLEPEIGGVVRMEGRLTKSPSFWVRDVDVTWKFTRIGSAIVPTELSSSARVIFHGRQPFKMTYEYEMVEGRAVAASTRTALQDQR